MAELPVAGTAAAAAAAATTNEATIDGVLHVVRVTVVGLTGITVDSAMEVAIGKDKELPAPPQQMRAVLAVMRDSETHGITALSKRLHETQAIEDTNGKMNRYQRYIAVWSKNRKASQDESVSFETKLPVGSDASRSMPHRNFDLIVGLTSGSSATVTPIGAASLPVAEAARLRGSNGKVVLDLPIYNFSSLTVNPFAKPSQEAAISLTNTSAKRSARQRETDMSSGFDQLRKKKALGYDYYMDPARDAAALRVELEVHEKESNVEVGFLAEQQTKQPPAAFLQSQPDHQAVETAHSVPRSRSIDIISCMEPSIERVLSVLDVKPKMVVSNAPRNKASPNRRFRAKVIDHTTMDFQLVPVKSKMVGVSVDDDDSFATNDDAKVWILDAAIERVLSVTERDEWETIYQSDLAAIDSASPSPKTSNGSSTPPRGPKAASLTLQPPKTPPGLARLSVSSRKIGPDKTEKTRRIGPFGLLRRRRKSKKQADLPAPKTSPKSALFAKPYPPSANASYAIGADAAASGGDGLASNQAAQSSLLGADSSISPALTPREASSKSTGKKWGYQKQRSQQQKQILSGSEISVGQRFGAKEPPSQGEAKPSVVTTLSSSSTNRTIPSSDSSSHYSFEATLKDSANLVSNASHLQIPCNSEAVPLLSSEAVSVASTSMGSMPGKDELGDEWKVEAVVDYFPDRQGTLETSAGALTPSSPDYSTYSNSLPNFSEEDEIEIFKERFDDDSIVEKGNFQAEHDVRMDQDLPIVARDLKRNLFGIMDIQPCAGKLESLIVDDEEDYTVADSWTQNDNSTILTNKSRKASLQDDLADLGLLLGYFCRPSGYHGKDDGSIDETASYRQPTEANVARTLWGTDGRKQRWMSGLGAAVQRPFVDDLDTSNSKHSTSDGLSWIDATHEDEDASFSSSSSGGSVSTEERTLESETQDETEESEQGTEVDVKDVKLAPPEVAEMFTHNRVTAVRKGAGKTSVKSASSRRSETRSGGSRSFRGSSRSDNKHPHKSSRSPSIGEQSKTDNLATGSQSMTQSAGVSTRLSEKDKCRVTRSWSSGPKEESSTIIGAVNCIPATKMSVAPLPKVTLPPTGKVRLAETPPKQIDGVERCRGSNSATDNQSPSNVMHPPMPVVPDSNLKSLAQSLVDLVDYVISPTPVFRATPATPPPIALVPSMLDAHETSSVGDLTATTYEMQVDMDEFKRQIERSERLAKPLGGRVYAGSDSPKDNYFSDYDQSSLMGPEMNAAMEAALVKQLAEI